LNVIGPSRVLKNGCWQTFLPVWWLFIEYISLFFAFQNHLKCPKGHFKPDFR